MIVAVSILKGGFSLPMPRVVFSLFAIFGSFLCFLNSPATLAADEIWVQKRRAESDAPGLCSVVLLFMDFLIFVYLKSPSNVRWRGIKELYKT